MKNKCIEFDNKNVELSSIFVDFQFPNSYYHLVEMLNNLSSDDVSLEMSLPNRAGILTPSDGLDEGEQVTMLVMPVMLNN